LSIGGGGRAKCTRYTKNPTKRCPKLGTPCLWYNDSLLFIAKSILQTLPPFKSYLCRETYQKHGNEISFQRLISSDRSEVQSQKEPLPFDGVPHTMEIFEKRLILGFESSIYSIDFGRKSFLFWSFENFQKEPKLKLSLRWLQALKAILRTLLI